MAQNCLSYNVLLRLSSVCLLGGVATSTHSVGHLTAILRVPAGHLHTAAGGRGRADPVQRTSPQVRARRVPRMHRQGAVRSSQVQTARSHLQVHDHPPRRGPTGRRGEGGGGSLVAAWVGAVPAGGVHDPAAGGHVRRSAGSGVGGGDEVCGRRTHRQPVPASLGVALGRGVPAFARHLAGPGRPVCPQR